MIADKKPEILKFFLDSGDVMIAVDTSREGVAVPSDISTQDVANFILGARSTPKLQIGVDQIIAPMRFGSSRFVCKFPWKSIVQISSENAVIQFQLEERGIANDEQQTANYRKYDSTRRKKPKLRVVK